jgi:hypothetical protein
MLNQQCRDCRGQRTGPRAVSDWPIAYQRGGAPRVRSSATIYVGGGQGGAQVKIGNVTECLFCGSAAGEISAERVLEGPRTVAFRDINPQAPVHVLVIPKDHYPDLASLAGAYSTGWPRRRIRWQRPKASMRAATGSSSLPAPILGRPVVRARSRHGRACAGLAARMSAASSMATMRQVPRRGRTIDGQSQPYS